jgi:predicted RNA-binding Zn-ribbon protein involved in translation (DUF1610 family)
MDCGPSRPGSRAGPFELGGRSDIRDPVQQAGGMMSPAAEELRILATAVSAVCGHPGFVPDVYLDELDAGDLGHPGADPRVLAAELCRAGVWERDEGGFRVLDEEAVQICVDRVRELREQDAWLAGLPDPAGSEPAVGAAGTTRFGDRVPKGTAASFRCGECGELAGVVRVIRASSILEHEPMSGEPGARKWLVPDYFLGTVWHEDTGDVVDAVQALIDQGNVDPATIREISWAPWNVTPFYCPKCRLNYCSPDWIMHFSVRAGTYDCIIGSCPNGHRHLLG